MPAPIDDGPVPFIEWWDEVFLPKEKRAELSKVGRGAYVVIRRNGSGGSGRSGSRL